MKNFLLEGHRPGVDWEKQTRVIEAETLSGAALVAENVGIVVVSATYIDERQPIAALRGTNPHLFAAWQTNT